MIYEHRAKPLISKTAFRRRLLNHTFFALSVILLSLFIGVLGYHLFESLSWIDALLNASMILGGMGPVNEVKTDAGKIFASMYALFSGLILIAVAGILIAPVFHRFLHKFHIQEK